MTIKLTSFLQCDDPDSLANNTKRPLNVNAPLFTPQSTMGNGGNILDQVRIVSNLSRYVFDILIKDRKFMIFFLGSNPKKKTNEQIVIISSQWVKSEKNAH